MHQEKTTDIALSVDLMEMACSSLKPDLVAMGSGDIDFVPLVVQLRERSIKVVCVTNTKQVSHDAALVCDQVIQVGASECPEPKAKAPVKAKI